MATLSTLELMLHEIQNQENLGDHGRMPELPQRPVSKARIPTRRSRRAILSFHLQEFGGKKKEEFVDDKSKTDGFAFVDGSLVLSKNNADEKERGIVGIQKCFRGYQTRLQYYKLKEVIITLQSLVRDWLSRRHPNYIQNTTTKNPNDANNLYNDSIENEEHVTVSEPYIRDLQRQVLRTEAALRHKKRENSLLALQIQQVDTKWELYKAKMSLKEKTWQDEFTSIQMSLAATQERATNEIIHFPQNPSRRHDNGKMDLTIRQILELQESDLSYCMHNIHSSEKGYKQDLKKLKGRFNSWKKEFKARLRDIKKTIDRFDDDRRTQTVHKKCWVA